jgi:hypothetical protein
MGLFTYSFNCKGGSGRSPVLSDFQSLIKKPKAGRSLERPGSPPYPAFQKNNRVGLRSFE